MTSSLIRGKYVIAKITGPSSAEVVTDGAVLQQDGLIAEVGDFHTDGSEAAPRRMDRLHRSGPGLDHLDRAVQLVQIRVYQPGADPGQEQDPTSASP